MTGGDIGFVQRELDRIAVALRKESDPERYGRLYAVQQALSWSLEPIGFRCPFEWAMGTQEATEGYSESPRQPASSGMDSPVR